MPACTAHYQFGQEVLRLLDADTRSLAITCRNEYDIGLQGPDIFYYYKPYRPTGVADYGVACHTRPAIHMFAPMAEKVQGDAARSYFMGLVCHYALDRCCHPYICKCSRDSLDHREMEAAFDRYIISRCGLNKARYLYMPDRSMDYAAIASLWPVTADVAKQCIQALRRYTRLLDHKKFLAFCETLAGKRGTFTSMSLPGDVTAIQTQHIRRLDRYYQQALDECPGLIHKALELMKVRQKTGPEFDLNYEGVAANE